MAALSPFLVFARVRWQASRWRRLPGFGAGLLGLCLLLLGGSWLAWQQARSQWQAQQIAARAGQPLVPLSRPAAQERRAALAEFYAALPAQDELPGLVQSLLDLAEQQGLRAAQGNYRLEPEPAAPMARFRVSMPLHGDPSRVQRFVLAALLAHPTLALDGLQFKSGADGSTLFEAKVQFVMFLQAGAVPARAVPPPASAPAAATMRLSAPGKARP